MKVVGSLPKTPEGVTEMSPHYEACSGAAKSITEQIIVKSEKEHAAREQQ
jgi:hypothetical protein